MKKSASYEIALSALSCAFATIALTVGLYVDFLLAAGYVLAIFALMIPLSKGYVRGDLLAFFGAVILAFLFGAFAIFRLLPFAVFFGLHPLINYLERRFFKKKWQRVLSFFGKALWFDLAMWLLWAVVLVPVFGIDSATWYPYVVRYFYWILFLGGTAFFAIYDRMIVLCQRSADYAVARIGR